VFEDKARRVTTGKLTDADKARYIRALDEYGATGTNTVECDVCGCPIRFERRNETATIASCDCGKFNDTLRGI
jgi:hypothetical protein